MSTYYPLFINGEFKETRNREVVINPANGEVIAEAAVASAQDVESALNSARVAFDKGKLGKLSRWYVPFSRLFELFKQVKIK